jgi:hypothetical protein
MVDGWSVAEREAKKPNPRFPLDLGAGARCTRISKRDLVCGGRVLRGRCSLPAVPTGVRRLPGERFHL